MNHQIIIPEVERIGREAELGADSVIALCDAFAPHFQEFHLLAQQAKDIGQDEPKRAREMRLKVRAVRIACEKTHKDQKADSLRRGKAIDGIKNVLLLSLVPVEEGLEAIEKAEELRAAAKREALKHARATEVQPFADPAFYDLAGMPDAQYGELLSGLKAAHAAKIAAQEAAAKAEAERKAAEEAERKRLAEENARLAKIAAEERSAREEAERKAMAERAEAARIAKIESDKREAAERVRREHERKERQEADAKAQAALAAERKAREEAERKAREEHAKARAIADAREKAEREAKEAADREAKRRAAAPDQEKMETLAMAIDSIAIPKMNDEAMRDKIADQLGKLSSWIRRAANEMVA